MAYILAIWMFVSGIVDIFRGITSRRTYTNNLSLIVGGGLSVLLAMFIFFSPITTAVAFMWFLAVYIVIWIVFELVHEEKIRETVERRK